MDLVMAIVVGTLYGSGLYLMMRRGLVKLVVGLALLGHASNLLIFTVAGLTRAQPPIVAADAVVPPAPYADPLPQALILTSIVIGFGVLAFTLALIHRVHQMLGTDDLDQLRSTDGRA